MARRLFCRSGCWCFCFSAGRKFLCRAEPARVGATGRHIWSGLERAIRHDGSRCVDSLAAPRARTGQARLGRFCGSTYFECALELVVLRLEAGRFIVPRYRSIVGINRSDARVLLAHQAGGGIAACSLSRMG